MKELIGFVAAVLAIISHIPYILDILRGKTKPHLYTWIIWAIVTVLACIYYPMASRGGGAGSWTTGVTLTVYNNYASLF